MPRYSQHCCACDWQGDIVVPVGTHRPCPQCGEATERLWVGTSASVNQDSWEGGKTFENLGDTPVTVYSRSELKRELKARGLQEMVRHVPVPGTDRSPHPSSWAVPCEYTLRSAQALLARVTSVAAPEPGPAPGDVTPAQVAKVVHEFGWS